MSSGHAVMSQPSTGELMPQTFYSEEEYQALNRENQRLATQLEAVESLRPNWVKGYTSDSMAAQGATNALQSVWTLLKVKDQTACMLVLQKLLDITAANYEP
jgi:hypothetical protein